MSDATATPTATASPPSVDAQDPLPESNWLWRRIFVFLLTAALLVLVWIKVDSVADVARMGSREAIEGLVSLLRWCLWLIGILVLFYLLAPSAEQTAKLIQTARSLREGVRFQSVTRASGPEGTVETMNTAGPAPAPLEPEIPEPTEEELRRREATPAAPATPARPAAVPPTVDLSQE